MDDINPDNLVVKYHALVNRDLCEKVKPLDHFQFERLGYFVCDPDSECDKGRYVFNLTVDLGDGKINAIKKLNVKN